ncbi:hypothetical protein IQ05_00815 [Flavobacterium tiangeerense]|uniref:CR-type domain-containing protein n=1 Tax=Flavobacterium tiangeerense TaxID=459471 RepID=A0ABY3FLL1_9FLAO|nr:hypothetical protein [Flavobacterium tiangeerense]TWI01242.1 hypothetical protein IQ05_00815 [Flavobacterium tiangeerense]
MEYKQELNRPEWKEKRKVILERDRSQCKKCNIKRSEFLGFSFEFGILNYEELIIKGFVLKKIGKFSENIEISKNGTLLKCKLLIDNLKETPLNKLNLARQWTESNHILSFSQFELVCFNEDNFDVNKFFDLNIHHKYYQLGKKAWEYEDNALITLCNICHKNEHKNNKIPKLNQESKIIGYSVLCDKCDGSGVILEYKYHKNGTCFKCNGTGDM